MQNFEISFTRLGSYESSFMPSTLKLWNQLDVNIRNCESLSQFKKCIRIIPPKISDHLSIGERKYNVFLIRIRHNCSSLHNDLFGVNIIVSPRCDCGADIENADHYFFDCIRFHTSRNKPLLTLNFIQGISSDLLVNGSSDYDYDTNELIISATLKILKESGRFE